MTVAAFCVWCVCVLRPTKRWRGQQGCSGHLMMTPLLWGRPTMTPVFPRRTGQGVRPILTQVLIYPEKGLDFDPRIPCFMKRHCLRVDTGLGQPTWPFKCIWMKYATTGHFFSHVPLSSTHDEKESVMCLYYKKKKIKKKAFMLRCCHKAKLTVSL